MRERETEREDGVTHNERVLSVSSRCTCRERGRERAIARESEQRESDRLIDR